MIDRGELQSVVDRYDIYLTGSDQIWSNRIPELVEAKEDFTGVYFFDFADYNNFSTNYINDEDNGNVYLSYNSFLYILTGKKL